MSVLDNYNKIYSEVELCSKKAGHKVELLAVSKNQRLEKMEELAKNNVLLFGESKVQEALPKIEYLSNKYNDLSFHFIGKVQTNKLKKIVEYFDLIHSVDREDVLKLINDGYKIYTFEEHTIIGGLGSAVAEIIAESGQKVAFKRIGINDKYSHVVGSAQYIREQFKLDIKGVIEQCC